MGGQRPAFPRAREKLSFLSSQAPAAPCSSGWEGPGPTGDQARCPYYGDILCLCPRPWEGCGDHLGAAPVERPGQRGCLASGPGGPLATGRGGEGWEQQNPSGALHLNAESKGASWGLPGGGRWGATGDEGHGQTCLWLQGPQAAAPERRLAAVEQV